MDDGGGGALSLSLSPPSPEATGAESKAATEQEMRARGDEERHFPPLTSPGSERAQLRARSPESKLAFARINPLPL